MNFLFNSLDGCFDGIQDQNLRGWSRSTRDPKNKIKIEVMVDGVLVAHGTADRWRSDLAAAGVGDGFCAFDIAVKLDELVAARGYKPILVEVFVRMRSRRQLGAQVYPGGEPRSFPLGFRWGALSVSNIWALPKLLMFAKFLPKSQVYAETQVQEETGSARKATYVGPVSTSKQVSRTSPSPADAVWKPQAPHAPKFDQPAARPKGAPLKYRIVGHIDDHYSLSVVNRGIALALSKLNGTAVSIYHYHGQPVSGLPQRVSANELTELGPLLRDWSFDEADADQRISICHHYPPICDKRPARLRLAIFFWEESKVPDATIEHFNAHFDGLLVASRFVKKVLRDSGCKLPIRVFPLGVDRILEATSRAFSAGDKTDDRPFRFLHVSSAFPRKGVDALLQAYFEEFAGREKVELVIKTFPNPHNDVRAQLERFRSNHTDPPCVSVVDLFESQAGLVGLYESADVVVFPTRGEGFNLPAAEAMSLGVPTIATGFGAHCDFLTSQTGWLIDYAFTLANSHVTTGHSLWVDPSIPDLKATLRAFYLFGTRSAKTVYINTAANFEPSRFNAIRDRARSIVVATYRWANAASVIDSFAHSLISDPIALPSLRVAWISSWNVRCGIAEYSRCFTSAMKSHFREIVYICDTRTIAAKNVHPLFSASGTENLAEAFDFIESQFFDLIVIQHQPTLFDLTGEALTRMATLQEEVPVLLFLHSTKFLLARDQTLVSRIASLLKLLERIFVHTVDDLTYLKQLGVVDNVTYFPHGVISFEGHFSGASARNALEIASRDCRSCSSIKREALLHSLDAGKFWIGSFGFLLPHKGLDALIQAIHLLHSEGHSEVRLILTCAKIDSRSEIEACRLQKLATELNVTNSVIFVDQYLPLDQVLLILSQMDLLVFPYRNTSESASGAVRVGLASGRPVLVSREGIFGDLTGVAHVADGPTASDLARAIDRFILDSEHLHSHAEEQKRWLSIRSWSTLANQFANLVEGICVDRAQDRRDQKKREFERVEKDVHIDTANIVLCPPGVDYPLTGRALLWQRNIFALDGSRRLSHVTPDCTVVWDDQTLSLGTYHAGTIIALHHIATYCQKLTESVFVASIEAVERHPANERRLIFEYARRYNLRSVLWTDSKMPYPAVAEYAVLADVIVTSDRAAQLLWREAFHRYLVQARNGLQTSRPCALPQLYCTALNRDLIFSELIAVRSVITYASRAAKASDIFDCVKNHATFVNEAANTEIFQLIETGEATESVDAVGGWAIADLFAKTATTRLLIADYAEPHRRTRVGVLMPKCQPPDVDDDDTLKILKRADLLIFESEESYRSVFHLICKKPLPVSLLRKKSAVLERGKNESSRSLLERLCRILRTIRPLRSPDYFRYFPLIASSPLKTGPFRLSVCISTYNRAGWLRVTLPQLVQEVGPFREQVELIVVDNASTDDTASVGRRFRDECGVGFYRNEENVGMLGNLGVTARHAKGDYIWILGDDDIVKPGTVGRVLEVIATYPRAELIYLNYAYTHFDEPSDAADLDKLISSATPISQPGRSGFFETIKEFAAFNENFFTAIYACIFRRDHAIAAYTQNTNGPPFSDLLTCAPITHYVLNHMLDRPGFWVGSNQIIVNMNVSWMRFAPVWHITLFPEIFDLAELMGVDSEQLVPYRVRNLQQGLHFLRDAYDIKDGYVASLIHICRYIEATRGVLSFDQLVDRLLEAYDAAREMYPSDKNWFPSNMIRSQYALTHESADENPI